MNKRDPGFAIPGPEDLTPENLAKLEADLAADRPEEIEKGGENDLTEFRLIMAFQDWLRDLQFLAKGWDEFKRRLREARKGWPGLRALNLAIQYMPIYATWGPPGTGCSWETAEGAAEFILEESKVDAKEDPEPGKGPVEFTAEDLAQLRHRGDQIEKAGWGIRLSRVRRGWWGMVEWDGF